MIVRVTDIALPLDADETALRGEIARRAEVQPGDVADVRIRRRAVDARSHTRLRHVYTVEADVPVSADRIDSLPGVTPVTERVPNPPAPGSRPLHGRPVVVGSGPAGLFAAWRLAQHGYAPLLLERGKAVEERRIDTAAFWKRGELDPDSNVLFGEGGAGAFSDGKLTTRIKDPRRDEVLHTLAECGAPSSITFDARPHVGTNRLPRILHEMRRRLIAAGCDVQFSTRVDDVDTADGRVAGIRANGGRYDANAVILAIGHSARDTYAMLHEQGIAMEAKAFAMGVRVQHRQELVDRAQYGKAAGSHGLEPAEYVLRSARTKVGRAVYSFCMCPGGAVIPCASEPGMLCCNGMSGESRSGAYANGAVVAEVSTSDFPEAGALGGVELQRLWERRAYEASGESYALPVMPLDDLAADRYARRKPGDLALRRFPRAEPCDLRPLMPDQVSSAIREATQRFARQIPGFLGSGAVAFGIETRTSSPVRILRSAEGESVSHRGLFPAGEGAGYAGGIVSAAVDGLRAAEALIQAYARP